MKLALVAVLVVSAACGGSQTATPALSPSASTPAPSPQSGCGQPTPASTEGPYYKAGPPQKTSLVESGAPGTRLVLGGVVRDASCAPLNRARVDFWQADGEGNYDNQGYKFRGYQLTDAQGRYRVETVTPGEYPGRTPHIHVKVTPQGGETLTTQLYMPGAESNESDSIYNPALQIKLQDGRGTFDFVVPR